MLACAYFDDEGNVMVTNEGALPSQKIAKRFALQVTMPHLVHDWSNVDKSRNLMTNSVYITLFSVGYGKYLITGRVSAI